MNNMKKTIFKTQTEDASPPVTTGTYYSGTYACIGGEVGIISPVLRGSIYYVGDITSPFSVTHVFSDMALTIPIPYNYIRIESIPKHYLTVDTGTGEVVLNQPEGDPC